MSYHQTQALEQLEAIFNADESLPLKQMRLLNQYLPVFGAGPADADIMLIGEAPGKQEALTGQPFVGSAGKQLDSYLKLAQIDRREVYITSVVKDRPPKNRTPTKSEIGLYKPYLLKQIEIIKPLYIVTLGNVALLSLAEFIAKPSHWVFKLGQLHGEVLEMTLGHIRIDLIPMFHPAAVFYNRDLEEIIQQDFKNLRPLFSSTSEVAESRHLGMVR